MAKTIEVTKNVWTETTHRNAREFYTADVSNTHVSEPILVDAVEQVLKHVKGSLVGKTAEAVTVKTPVALGDTVTAYLKAKYELEDQFTTITFTA